MQTNIYSLPKVIIKQMMLLLDLKSIKTLRLVDKKLNEISKELLIDSFEKNEITFSESYFFEILKNKIDKLINKEIKYSVIYINRNGEVVVRSNTLKAEFKLDQSRNKFDLAVSSIYSKVAICISKDESDGKKMCYYFEHLQNYNLEYVQKEIWGAYDPKNNLEVVADPKKYLIKYYDSDLNNTIDTINLNDVEIVELEFSSEELSPFKNQKK